VAAVEAGEASGGALFRTLSLGTLPMPVRVLPFSPDAVLPGEPGSSTTSLDLWLTCFFPFFTDEAADVKEAVGEAVGEEEGEEDECWCCC